MYIGTRYNDYIGYADFSVNPPENWKEIAEFLNDMIRALAADVNEIELDYDQEVELRHLVQRVWDDYWDGEIDDAPEPVYEKGAVVYAN